MFHSPEYSDSSSYNFTPVHLYPLWFTFNFFFMTFTVFYIKNCFNNIENEVFHSLRVYWFLLLSCFIIIVFIIRKLRTMCSRKLYHLKAIKILCMKWNPLVDCHSLKVSVLRKISNIYFGGIFEPIKLGHYKILKIVEDAFKRLYKRSNIVFFPYKKIFWHLTLFSLVRKYFKEWN